MHTLLTTECRLSQRELADQANVSARTIRNYHERLEALDLIRVGESGYRLALSFRTATERREPLVPTDLEIRDQIFHPTVENDSLYERVATRLGSVDVEELTQNVLLANSEWTADAVEDAYGTRLRVLYPPIDTSEFEPQPWEDCEDGIVTTGRVERSKRIRELIEITDGTRERGLSSSFSIPFSPAVT